MPDWLVLIGLLGLVRIWTDSFIAAPLRLALCGALSGRLHVLCHCAQCIGFWAGLALGFFLYPGQWLRAILLAGATSLFGLIQLKED